ncbi:MAG: DUF167 domain-containing protein [Planctomycetia bacterium]|nr:DUF167 domain-containing protein [Planctomycetia bacterium]
MLNLEQHLNSGGLILLVKAIPGARKNEIRDVAAGMLKVACTQIAERGKANKAILEILCKNLNLRKSQIFLLSGETDSHKKFLITDISCDELLRRISEQTKSK